MLKDYFAQLSDNKTPPTYKFFNGQQWVDSYNGKLHPVISPVDGKLIGNIQTITHGEIDQSIARAKKAQPDWQQTPIVNRSQILRLAADWLREHEDFMTVSLIKEIGKSIREAKDEVLRSADMIDYFANAALNDHGEELSGESFPGYDQTKTAVIKKAPLGVVLAISPFNYPINLSVSKIAPALVMGNSVVFKPPTQGAISSIYLSEIFRIAGLPDGVLTTLTGAGDEIGNYLCTHRDIDMVTFTGSSQVGNKIAEKIGMIPILFECGGNNPALVLPDAEMATTVSEIVKGAFSYAGQRCTAIKYILALEPTIDKLLPRMVEKTKESIHMGDPRIEKNNLGPLISDTSALEIEKQIMIAKAHGARIVWGGKRQGRYIEPTILDRVKASMDIVQKEIFGPVISLITVDSIDEAIKIINESEFGLQASVFTSDEGAGFKLAEQIDVGTVQINSKPQRGPDHFPFLGIKGSGIGVQGIKYTLEAMTRPKPIILNKPH